MHRKIFIDQLKRSKKTVVYFWLLLIAATFFVTSMNLYYNSTSNLQLSENTFSTLAVTELYGEVDRYGELVERNSDAHIGYQAVGVKGYDIAPILQSDAVESYDLRSQYGRLHRGVSSHGVRSSSVWRWHRNPGMVYAKQQCHPLSDSGKGAVRAGVSSIRHLSSADIAVRSGGPRRRCRLLCLSQYPVLFRPGI